MLQMAQINCIRLLNDRKDMSIREIARTVEVNRKTVAKYVNQEDFSPVVSAKRKKRCPVLGPFMPIIDQWLESDRKERKKQRHTAKRIYDRLVAEHGYQGSERNVRLYVSRKKKELYSDKPEGYIPLEHQPGEAQVDFGEMDYRDAKGITRKGYFLNVSFPYSNAGFVQVFKGQNQECLLEGLKNIFKFIGGVPWLMVFDNLSAAVVKIKPERVLTENFERFANHYGFEFRFCNPASGNEKGSVESKVGYHRRNLFVPVPTIIDFEDYNREIIKKSRIKMSELHYEKKVPISELFLKDQRWLLALPSVPFENFRLQRVTSDKFGRVKIENKRYSVAPSYAQQNLWAKLYHDRVQVLNDHYETIIEHPRLYGEDTEAMNWLPYLKTLAQKPGALLNTSFYGSLPGLWQQYLKQTDNRTRKSAILLLMNIIKENKLDAGTEALEMAGLYGRTDPDSVRQLYYHLTHRTEMAMPFDSPLASYHYNPSLTVYNGLLKAGVTQ